MLVCGGADSHSYVVTAHATDWLLHEFVRLYAGKEEECELDV
jgi:hypothetical protein